MASPEAPVTPSTQEESPLSFDEDKLECPFIALNNFNVELFKKILEGADAQIYDNMVISPLAITGSLLSLLEGSRGATRRTMLSAIGVSERSTCKEHYHSTIHQDVLENNNFVDSINKRLSEALHGTVSTLINPAQTLTQTEFLMTNAVFFRGFWQRTFPREFITTKPFYVAPGLEQDTVMMYEVGPFNCAVKDDFRCISIPYKSQNQTSMLLFIPAAVNGLPDLLRKLNFDLIERSAESLILTADVCVALPRQRLKSPLLELKAPLQNLGLSELFSAEADLSGVIKSERQMNNVYHRCVLDIIDEGYKTTDIDARQLSSLDQLPDDKKFFANKPFLFVIRNFKKHIILFIGVVKKPDLSLAPALSNPLDETRQRQSLAANQQAVAGDAERISNRKASRARSSKISTRPSQDQANNTNQSPSNITNAQKEVYNNYVNLDSSPPSQNLDENVATNSAHRPSAVNAKLSETTKDDLETFLNQNQSIVAPTTNVEQQQVQKEYVANAGADPVPLDLENNFAATSNFTRKSLGNISKRSAKSKADQTDSSNQNKEGPSVPNKKPSSATKSKDNKPAENNLQNYTAIQDEQVSDTRESLEKLLKQKHKSVVNSSSSQPSSKEKPLEYGKQPSKLITPDNVKLPNAAKRKSEASKKSKGKKAGSNKSGSEKANLAVKKSKASQQPAAESNFGLSPIKQKMSTLSTKSKKSRKSIVESYMDKASANSSSVQPPNKQKWSTVTSKSLKGANITNLDKAPAQQNNSASSGKVANHSVTRSISKSSKKKRKQSLKGTRGVERKTANSNSSTSTARTEQTSKKKSKSNKNIEKEHSVSQESSKSKKSLGKKSKQSNKISTADKKNTRGNNLQVPMSKQPMPVNGHVENKIQKMPESPMEKVTWNSGMGSPKAATSKSPKTKMSKSEKQRSAVSFHSPISPTQPKSTKKSSRKSIIKPGNTSK